MKNKVKYVLQNIIKNKTFVDVDEVSYDFEAPTDTGKEVAIDLFPRNYGNHDVQKYYEDCMSIFEELNCILPNDVVYDISKENTWNFIYVII